MDQNEELIRDFIHQKGIFDPLDGIPFVEEQDRFALSYYKDAVKEILARAEGEESVSERLRLHQVVRRHHYEMDRILEKYEDGSWFRS